MNIQTINIDDYETVLEAILQKNEPYIRKLFPSAKKRLVDIDGMQWIIHGKNFGVRDIKDRLNRAFTLFSSLRSRFKDSPIEFEKCAVVAYLTTTHEKDFNKTGDLSFGTLVEAHLQHTVRSKQNRIFCATPCVFNDFVVELVKSAGYTLLDRITLRIFVRPATSFVRIEDFLHLDKQKVVGFLSKNSKHLI